MKRFLPRIAGYLIGAYVVLLRWTCRFRLHNDQRHQITASGHQYVFGTFHAHQITGLMAAERGTGAIVSRSVDGEMVVPMLIWSGHVPIRGSSGTGRKGGATALQALIKHVNKGNGGMLAVDGPKGPRGEVQRGIGLLAQKTNSAIIMAIGVPTTRFVIRKTWDQFQIPAPFSTIDLYMADPLLQQDDESLEDFIARAEVVLRQLEHDFDAEEVIARGETPQPSEKADMDGTRRAAA